jgi:hypothetical protein
VRDQKNRVCDREKKLADGSRKFAVDIDKADNNCGRYTHSFRHYNARVPE